MSGSVRKDEDRGELSALRSRVTEFEREIRERKKAEDALREREERLARIYASANDGIFVVDPLKDEIMEANPKAAELVGYSIEEMTGMPMSAFHPDEMPLLMEFAEGVFSAGSGMTDALTCSTKDGRKVPIEMSASAIHWEGRSVMLVLVRDITERIEADKALRGALAELEQRTQELRETQDVTVSSLAALAETRDKETGQHLERTRRYVNVLAEWLQNDAKFRGRLTPEAVEQLYKSAPLHDIGKVGVSDQVLRKSGSLSEKEFEEMKRHTVLGGDTLRSAEERLGFDSFLSVARDIAYYHHERWDGQGYPSGLEGEGIPLCARLMALGDVYDALRTRRAYKEPYPHEKAVEIIREGRGAHFDPDVVDAFMDTEGEFAEIAESFREPQPVGRD